MPGCCCCCGRAVPPGTPDAYEDEDGAVHVAVPHGFVPAGDGGQLARIQCATDDSLNASFTSPAWRGDADAHDAAWPRVARRSKVGVRAGPPNAPMCP